jgi:putative ABC transport system permease protein
MGGIRFRHYLVVALRSLSRNRVYSAINILGLALVICLYVMDELSYDRYHEKADRIYRVVMDARLMGEEIKGAVSPAPMSQALIDEIPEVETSVRLWHRGDVVVANGDRKFTEEVFYADATYFSVFTHPLIEGDPQTGLAEPKSVVLTGTASTKLFGAESPVGKTVSLNDDDYVVTGLAENIPHNAHVHFDYLASLVSREDSRNQMWVSNNYYTYLVAAEGASVAGIESKLEAMVLKYAGPQIKAFLKVSFEEFVKSGGKYRFELQALPDVHLQSNFDIELEPPGDILYVYMFTSVAILVILVACINYTNLTTARASSRSVEINMRKAVGANRSQLIRQFLGESLLQTILAFLLAVSATAACLPYLSSVLEKPLTFAAFGGSHYAAAAGLVLLVGLGAGSYPAFLLASFRPQQVLKGAAKSTSRGTLRNILVFFQFVVSVVLVVGTVVIFEQIQFVQSKHLGFDKEQVVVVQRAWPIRKKLDAFRNELFRDSRIVSVGGANDVPGEWFGNSAFIPEGAPGEKSYLLWRLVIDDYFLETMRMPVIEGRGFSTQFTSDSSAVLLNEAAVRHIVWPDPASGPIGQRITEPGDNPDETITHTVIGVVKDFHFESLREGIRPVIVQNVRHPETSNVQKVVIRIETEDYPSVLRKIEDTWTSIAPGQPFIHSFLDSDLDALYRADQKTAGIAGGFSIMAIVVGCLGLFGLTSFMAEQRTKEIGVRKTLGASEMSVMQLLAQDIFKLVFVGNVIAWPIAYYMMNQWLQDFAYRTSLGAWPFLAGAMIALLVTALTVSFQTVKAARMNPIEALRYE